MGKIMEKDKTILSLIEKLKTIIDLSVFKIIDYWDADLCAIGIKKGEILIYISTNKYRSYKIIKYDYDIEMDNVNPEKIELIKEVRGASESELIKDIISI